jgi:hypothetical protein
MGVFLGTYDPEKVTMNFGPYTISGFSDGDFIKASPMDADLYKIHVGAHGEMARTKNPNKVGFITFTLKATSPSNKILDAIKNSGTPVPVLMKDSSDSAFIATAANAWVTKQPEHTRGVEESKVEWVVACDELLMSNI